MATWPPEGRLTEKPSLSRRCTPLPEVRALLRGSGWEGVRPIGCEVGRAPAGLRRVWRMAAGESAPGAAWEARGWRDVEERACLARPLWFRLAEGEGVLREAPAGDADGTLRPPGFLLLGMGVLCHLLHALAVIRGQLLK